jgi:threonine dehydratase
MNAPLMTKNTLTLTDIQAAAKTIHGHVLHTPLVPAPRLSALTGANIWVKHENMQATAAFKERGAVNKLLSLTDEQKKRGVIAMSAGNHAQGVAYHAQRFGIPATIVMPLTTPLVKVENTRGYAAKVVLHGNTLNEATLHASETARIENLTFVHPYDDALVMAGQGTIALEMLEANPDLDVLVIPIGGGGLCAGCAVAAKAIKPSIEIIGVEAALYPAVAMALYGKGHATGGATLAEGIAVTSTGQLTLPILRELMSDVILCEEPLIERAVCLFASHHASLAEGAGAAGLAALLAEPKRFLGRNVGLILCGSNIDARILAGVMVRELERAERIVSFRITMSDRPGLLGRVSTRLGELEANILEVSHGRLFLDVPAKGVSVDLTIETRNSTHTQAILAALEVDGFNPVRIPSHRG